MDTALGTPPWQEFTRRYWNVEPVRFDYAPRGDSGPKLSAVFYTGADRRLMLPPYQPHAPLRFSPTATDAAYRIQRQWLDTARLLVDDMQVRGIRGELTFSTAMVDPRPWSWAHFRVAVRFTNFIDFPFQIDQADRVVRQQANKAVRAGLVCSQTDRLEDALACLCDSEGRQGFDYGITLAGLELARELLGPEAFRVYLCATAQGEPVSARVVLHQPRGRACDWLAGTRNAFLSCGATQLLLWHVLDDLARAGACGYNSCGADIEPVAQAKAAWGGRLVPQYSLIAYDFRSNKHLLGEMFRFIRRRRRVRREKAPGEDE